MIDDRRLKDTVVYGEEIDLVNWFDYKQKKYLHNIDTFYYSVKLENDFTNKSKDTNVLKFRRYFEKKQKLIENYTDSGISLNFGECDYLNFTGGCFARMYNIHLERPDYFDIFIAPTVPSSSPDEKNSYSNTTEIVIQIRSYMLWLYGVNHCIEESKKYVEAICNHFNLNILFFQENRIDYCWHTNYLQNPERFFAIENLYKMRVDRFKDAYFHTAKVGVSDYEIDYISMGKRSDKVFIRIYLKSKEVVEKGYKSWFFKVWLFNGLINRYDFYVYEKMFMKKSWHYMDKARLEWYLEYGQNEEYLNECRNILIGDVEISDTKLKELANKLTPRVTLIINVEFQTMRKHSKSYELVPFRDNTTKGNAKRIYDYLDNRKLICDYLTHYTLRLVNYEEESDTNKSRCDYVGFWNALRRTKLVDVKLTPNEIKLTRLYARNLNAEMLKKRIVNSCITYGIYTRGKNEDDVTQDLTQALCMLNDNDIFNARNYKGNRMKDFNEKELEDTFISSEVRSYAIVNIESGEVIGNE